MRLIVTGKTRAGKTTALCRILMHALRQDCWLGVVLLDGKGGVFQRFATLPGVLHAGPERLDLWAEFLGRVAEGLPERYKALADQGLSEAPPAAPRWLIVVDECQRGVRDREHGRAIRSALNTIAEQSGALGDVLVVSAQRPQTAIPVSVRWNANARLVLLGGGFFLYQADGSPARTGRVAPPDAAPLPPPQLPLSPSTIPDILSPNSHAPSRISATLYLGERGAGKTYALRQHCRHADRRSVYIDASQPHRQCLAEVLSQLGAPAPDSRLPIPAILEMCCLALRGSGAMLLVDNVHQASQKTIQSLTRLVEAAGEAALAAEPPRSDADERKLQPLATYCRTVKLAPLSRSEAVRLALEYLPPDLPDRPSVARRIAAAAGGNPGNIVALSRRVRTGSLSELRELPPLARKVPLGWVMTVLGLAALIVARWSLPPDAFWLSFVLLALSILLRPFFYQSIRRLRQ